MDNFENYIWKYTKKPAKPEFDDIFKDFFTLNKEIKTKIVENKNETVISVCLPGVSKEEITVSRESKETLKISFKSTKDNLNTWLTQREYSETFSLLRHDLDKVSATFKDGILTVTIPREKNVSTEAKIYPINE